MNGLYVPLGLLQVRVTVLTVDRAGFAPAAIAYDSPTTYRPVLTLSAVRPSPNRSYEMPNLGSTSFQSGTFSMASNRRAGVNGPAGMSWGSERAFRKSRRT